MRTGTPLKPSTDLELLLSAVELPLGHNTKEEVILFGKTRLKTKTTTKCWGLCLTQIESKP